VRAAIAARLRGFNLELLNQIACSLIRDTEVLRGRVGGGMLDNWRQVPFAERYERLSQKLAERGIKTHR
jgi:hypothetical protein